MTAALAIPNLRTADPVAWKLATRYADFIGVTLNGSLLMGTAFSRPYGDTDLIGSLAAFVILLCSVVAAARAPFVLAVTARSHPFSYGMLPLILALPWALFAAAFEIGGQLKNFQDLFPPLREFWPAYIPIARAITLGSLAYSAAFASSLSLARRYEASRTFTPLASRPWPPAPIPADPERPTE
jgi:hypothetical protein